MTAQVPAGDYEVACKPGMTGDGIRTAVTVTGSAPTADPAQAAAVDAYRATCRRRPTPWSRWCRASPPPCRAGDVAGRRRCTRPSARRGRRSSRWPRASATSTRRIDLREADLEPGQEWTGWHRLEKALWVDGSTAGLAPVADQLVADVQDLQARVQNADLTVAVDRQRRQGAARRGRHRQDHRRGGGLQPHRPRRRRRQRRRRPQGLRGAAAGRRRRRAGDRELDGGVRRPCGPRSKPYARGAGYVSYDTVDDAGRRELAPRRRRPRRAAVRG